jgi:hypothetical protein
MAIISSSNNYWFINKTIAFYYCYKTKSAMTDLIEPETKRYLKKIMQTVFVGLFWMFANVIVGIFLELGFVNNGLTLSNILYFSISFITLVLLVWYFIKMWSAPHK